MLPSGSPIVTDWPYLCMDGEASYASRFSAIFGQAYRPSRQGTCGRFPDLRYRIPRTLAHVQIV